MVELTQKILGFLLVDICPSSRHESLVFRIVSRQITPRLLETKDVDAGQRGRLDDRSHAMMKSIPLT